MARLTRQDLQKFYREKYVPDNVVFVVVGDIESEKAFLKIKNAFKEFKRRPAVLTPIPKEPPQIVTRYFEKLMPVKFAGTIMGYHTVSLLHEDIYPLDIVAYILGQGRSARLLKEIVYMKKLATDISVYSETPFNGAGSFVVAASIVEGADIERGTEAMLEVIGELKEHLVAEDELARAKAQTISNFVYDNRDVEDQAETIGWDIIGTGDPEFSRRFVKKIQGVTREDIRRVACRYFSRENLTVGVLRYPEMASVRSAKKKVPLRMSETRLFKLDNGLRLLVQESRTNPSVDLCACFQGGLRFSTREKVGVFPLLRGTKNRSADYLAAEVEDMGGSISVYSGDNSFGINLDLISGSEEKGIEILADIILNSALSHEELANEKIILIEGIKSREEIWEWEVYDLYRSELFKKHPYGLPPKGIVKTVDNLSLADIRHIYRNFCVAGNLVIAVYGDVHTEKVLSKVTEAFSEMPAKGLKIKPPPRENPPGKKRIYSKAVEKNNLPLPLVIMAQI